MPDGTRAGAGVAPTDAVSAVAAALVADAGLAEQSFDKIVDLLERFAAFATTGRGVTELGEVSSDLVAEFVAARTASGEEPSVSAMHLRRAAVRLLFRVARQLGLADCDPTLDMALPPRHPADFRPLTNEDVQQCRAAALHQLSATRLPAAWALAEATVRTSELAHITVEDADLERGRVWVHGGGNTFSRWGYLSEWGRAQVARRLRALGVEAGARLVYEGKGSAKSRQASSCIAISVTLARAGLGDDLAVRPASVAAYAGRTILQDTGRIDIVAARLGMTSLDRAARFVGFRLPPNI